MSGVLKLGLIGSTDSHTSLATTTEDNFFGKVAAVEPTADPIRFDEVIGGIGGKPEVAQYARQTSASGLGVVAREYARGAVGRDGEGSADEASGARLDVADLVHARLTTRASGRSTALEFVLGRR